jgi:hypothetical protein
MLILISFSVQIGLSATGLGPGLWIILFRSELCLWSCEGWKLVQRLGATRERGSPITAPEVSFDHFKQSLGA